jgi:nitric oxide reductase NorD protein
MRSSDEARGRLILQPRRRGGLPRFVLGVGDDRGDNEHRHPGQTLEGVLPVLGLYYRALSGRNAALLPDGGEGGDAERYVDTHTTLRLPARIARFRDPAGNVGWYKVALTHRAAHYSCGTFAFSYESEARLLPRLRPPAGALALDRYDGESGLETFFRLFSRRALAAEMFAILEDTRLDQWAKRRYPGLSGLYERVERDALSERRSLESLMPRDALAELAVRMSLGDEGPFQLPAFLHEPARQMRALIRTMRFADASVEDAAEAALRAYSLVVRMPNLAADCGTRSPVDFAASPVDWEWPALWPEPESVRLEGDEVLKTTIVPVGYRDRLGSRYAAYRGAGPLDQQAIFRFTETSESGSGTQPMASAPGDDLDRPAPPPEPMEHEHHHHGDPDADSQGTGELHSHEQFWFIYREWDHVRQRYRRNWCCLRESRLDPGPAPRFYAETLRSYRALVPEVRRELERLAYTGTVRARRMPQGDDLDLDAAIAALVDVRTGLAPDDDVYVSRRREARDVAVAFLVDMSSSTAEHVQVDASSAGARDRLVMQPGEKLHGRSYRTILDLEREALVVMMAALERIGDSYGIYFFSGTGREDVKFQVLKDLDERMSDRVAARLDSVKPVHTTRMGPAIRHATRKLRGHRSRTRLLILISDGRPFDLDYGQEYGPDAELDYAVQDTRQALDEARRAGIVPFILTIDTQGNDYLSALREEVRYEVLDDVLRLPARLMLLYRTLTG